MTTERADAPPAAGALPAPALPRPAAAVRPPRGPDRATLPPPRPGRGARRRTVAPLLAADCLATTGTALLVPGTGTAPAAAAAVVLVLLLHARAGLYRPGPAPRVPADLPALLGRSAVCWCAVAAVLAALHPGRALPPAALAGAVAAHTLLVCAGRATVHRARRNAARRGPRATLVVGTDPAARRLAAVLHAHPEYGMRPVGIVTPAPPGGPDALPPARGGPPRLTSAQDITRAVIRHTVRDAVFTVPPYADPHTSALLRRFIDQGSAIWLAGPAAAREGRTPYAGTDRLGGFACRRLDTSPPRHGGPAKRALDLALAGSALLLAAPLLLGWALALRLADGPGVLVREERTGRGGRPFTLLTLRTLPPGGAHGAATPSGAADSGRPGRLGRLLRRTVPAGLPRLWNVLRGRLSLVGPCPERPATVERHTRDHPEYGTRHRMRPGLTGLAQVHGLGGGAAVEDRARLDNLYIDSWSLWQDIRILLRAAAPRVRRGRG
ncbi:sugar transferase [Streptomyces angustmyceticus]